MDPAQNQTRPEPDTPPESEADDARPQGADAVSEDTGEAEDVTESAADQPAEDPPLKAHDADRLAAKPRRRRRRGLRLALWASGILTALLLGLAGYLYSLVGQVVVAPPWLHQRLEARLSSLLPEAEVQFDTLSVVVGPSGRPRVSLQGVDILDKNGRLIVTLNELETGLAGRPLLEGKLQLGRVRLSGAEVLVRRQPDGSFDLAFGQTQQQALSIPEVIGQMDRLLTTPELLDLREIRADSLILRLEDQRANRAWTVDGGRMQLTRKGEALSVRGDLALLGGYDYVSTVALNFDSAIGRTAASFGMVFEDMSAQDIAVQAAAVAWLDAVRAPISGALRGSITEAGSFGTLSGTLQIGTGVIQPTEATPPVPFRSARSYFTYEPQHQRLAFDELSLDSPWLTARAEGQTLLRLADNGLPQAFLGQFQITNLTAHPEDLLQQPVSLDAAEMSFRLRLSPFELQMGQLTLTKEEQTVSLNGRVNATPQGWALALASQTEALDPELVLQLWPEELKPKTRSWVADNVHSAKLKRGQLAFRKTSGQPHEIYAGFEFGEANVTFSRHWPAIEDGFGYAELLGKRFVVRADRGHITAPAGGQVDITGTTFVIEDVTVKPAPGEVNLVADGSVTAALALLNQPPLSLIDKAGRSIDLATGRVTARGTLNMPLKKKLPPQAVRFDIEAELRDVKSDTLVPKRVLRADRLELSANNARLVVAGRGRIGAVPFNAVYEDQLSPEQKGKAQVHGDVELSPRFLQEFNIALPEGTVSGRGQGRFVLDLERGQPPRFAVESDLAGLALRVPQLGWSLAQGTKGSLSARGRLTSPPRVDSIRLDAPGMLAEGAVQLRPDGQLDRVPLARVRVGNWLDVPATLVGRGAGRNVGVDILGGTLDLRRKPDAGGQRASAARGGSPMAVRLDRLQLTDSIALTGLQGRFDTARGLAGEFVAQVNGRASISGRVTPVGDRSSFEIRSKDAGAVMAAAGFMEKGRRGELVLSLKPVARDGHYDGDLKITNVRVANLPALAELLNAISVVGLLEQLSGSGVLFSDVEAKFRLTPKQLILRSGSAVGASMGLSIDGVFDLANKRMDLQGVVSPFYMLNAVGSILTRKGEGLIGFNYRLVGPTEKPRVQINPLSLFTPGMFREIFRRPPPEVPE